MTTFLLIKMLSPSDSPFINHRVDHYRKFNRVGGERTVKAAGLHLGQQLATAGMQLCAAAGVKPATLCVPWDA
jgi:hypothetical protein